MTKLAPVHHRNKNRLEKSEVRHTHTHTHTHTKVDFRKKNKKKTLVKKEECLFPYCDLKVDSNIFFIHIYSPGKI